MNRQFIIPAILKVTWSVRLGIAFLVATSLAVRSAPGQYRLVWGDMHGHTKLSDGKGSLDDFFTYARNVAKLDFVLVTDHDFGNGPPWRMPKAEWRLIQTKADQYTANGRFIALAAYEWTSAPKYWTAWKGTNAEVSERLFAGSPKYYNHKIVYLASRVDYLFSSKDLAYNSPDRLAEAVRHVGGLINNAHPDAGPEGTDQFDYTPAHAAIIANSEILPDVMRWQSKEYPIRMEQTLRTFLNRGGRTGFVGGSDTHDGHPSVHTAVLVRRLTRAALFDALRHRRNYAVTRDRIELDFRIDGHAMGEDITVPSTPLIAVAVNGTDRINEILLVRNGTALYSFKPGTSSAQFTYVDHTFAAASYYYVRVQQADTDEYGNPSCAWSSPIWVRPRR